ncbi:MAG TPA: ATP-binding cassette domain-containing protein [Thermoplasmata archaeon]|nr:ATP-binding cassette domain-containing protein [Thermoplasmata archaeon]
MPSPLLEVAGLSASFDGRPVLRGVNLTVGEGELLTVLGPNGSGKTTLLRLLAGFERPTDGSIRLDGRDLADVPPHRRGIGLLFQEPTLFARRTVAENIAYAPLLQRRPDAEVRGRVEELARLLDLGGLLDRLPEQLSGGERQRVALARSLAARPRLLLLDEPFASVDVEVRAGLHAEFRAALRASGTAAVHVTHDREEALFLGDRVALLFDGSLEGLESPRQLFEHPPSARAAAFLGYNVLPGADGPVAVLPDELRAVPNETAPTPYRVRASGPVGPAYLSVLEGPNGLRVELRSDRPLPPGSVVELTWTRARPVPPASARRSG